MFTTTGITKNTFHCLLTNRNKVSTIIKNFGKKNIVQCIVSKHKSYHTGTGNNNIFPRRRQQRLYTRSSSFGSTKPKVCWLDLNGSGLSAIERLCLEEALLRHDPLNRSWAIIGTHDPIYNTRLKKINTLIANNKNGNDGNIDNVHIKNDKCIIIMGIGGKPSNLLNMHKVKQDGVVVIKRFSGGGTVVVDHSSLWTTFIGRTSEFNHVQPFPKDIMKWSADEIFHNLFEQLHDVSNNHSSNMKTSAIESSLIRKKTLVMDTKSCGLAAVNKQKDIPIMINRSENVGAVSVEKKNNNNNFKFQLRENDYVLGDQKMGGNAQSIINGAWLHHTSFLWDYVDDHMEYLTLPDKRPNYRGDRHHDDFLIKLKSIYGSGCNGNISDIEGKRLFFSHLKGVSEKAFDIEEVSLSEAIQVVNTLGGFEQWFEGKCRTKIVDL